MSKCACKYYLNKMHLVCYCLNDGNIITGRDEVLEVPEAEVAQLSLFRVYRQLSRRLGL